MSLINSTTINNNQILLSTKDKREKYGEIFTPYSLIERMFEMLTPEDFTNPITMVGSEFWDRLFFYLLILEVGRWANEAYSESRETAHTHHAKYDICGRATGRKYYNTASALW